MIKQFKLYFGKSYCNKTTCGCALILYMFSYPKYHRTCLGRVSKMIVRYKMMVRWKEYIRRSFAGSKLLCLKIIYILQKYHVEEE